MYKHKLIRIFIPTNTKKMEQTIRCERCNEKLNPKTAVWLELSNTDNQYYVHIPQDHVSQGGVSIRKILRKN